MEPQLRNDSQHKLFHTIQAIMQAGKRILLLIRSFDGLCRPDNFIDFCAYWRHAGADIGI
jgi:hypothetical protein